MRGRLQDAATQEIAQRFDALLDRWAIEDSKWFRSTDPQRVAGTFGLAAAAAATGPNETPDEVYRLARLAARWAVVGR